jgi:hypothetical protein
LEEMDMSYIPDSELPEPVRSQMVAMMAQRDLEMERERADKMRDDSNKLYELRGWLRLCEDNPAGHAEFYQWACHYIFGDEPPPERESSEPETADHT